MERIGISVNGSSLVSFIQHLLQHLTQICAHLSAPGEPSAGHQGTAGSGGLTPPQLSGQTHFGENLQFEKLTTCCILVAQDNWDCFTCLNVLPIFRERWKTQTIPKPQKKKNLRLWLRGFAFGKFCQVTQADAILGIFLLKFSKPSVSNILVLSNIA